MVNLQHPASGKEIDPQKLKTDWLDRWKINPNRDLEVLERHVTDEGAMLEDMKMEIDSFNNKLRKIDYEIWDEIFTNLFTEPLGDRILGEILEGGVDRSVDAFEELDVQNGLNDRSSEAATTFIDSEPFRILADGSVVERLIDLLSKTTRNEVLKLVFTQTSIWERLFSLFFENPSKNGKRKRG